MSNDRNIKGEEAAHSVLREQDLDWLTHVAKDEAGLLILADAKGDPIDAQTLRRCLALGVIEPMSSEEGIGFRRTERALAFLESAPPSVKRDMAQLRTLLDAPNSPFRLAQTGGGAALQRRMQIAGSSVLLLTAAGFAAWVASY